MDHQERQDPQIKLAAEVVQSFTGIQQRLLEFTRSNAESLGLTVLQLAILNTLYTAPGMTLKELTERLSSPKSTISVQVEGLVQSGLVDRVISETDRREVKLSLSADGRERSLQSAVKPRSYQAMGHALEQIPASDVESLLRIHQEIQKFLEEYASR
ncbi:DNA-binding MarR family transcriptional regulator [Paenibacillus rhizosphaerae]|uniref:DNA-binding MarR family transcriptional regulator n=1 Tax=Paenibacillus rhizosphaerae TaxID=297318 RepID=A0A839U018_9BACL|nr:MarR family transcriptional regulator [Paenibacillus rhizosphaerae]MBB3130237.1 DNA-binding MarR family transcriptional regulator [Paenibacillus rhizosphaerae]